MLEYGGRAEKGSVGLVGHFVCIRGSICVCVCVVERWISRLHDQTVPEDLAFLYIGNPAWERKYWIQEQRKCIIPLYYK